MEFLSSSTNPMKRPSALGGMCIITKNVGTVVYFGSTSTILPQLLIKLLSFFGKWKYVLLLFLKILDLW